MQRQRPTEWNASWLTALAVVASAGTAALDARADWPPSPGSEWQLDWVEIPASEEARIFGGELPYDVHDGRDGQLYFSGRPIGRVSLRSDMSPVKNQGPRGACTAFAAVALLEYGRETRYSEQCLILESSGEDAGHLYQRIHYARLAGVLSDASCPYSPLEKDAAPPFWLRQQQRLWPGGKALFFWNGSDGFRRMQNDPVALVRQTLDAGLPLGGLVLIAGRAWFEGPQDRVIGVPDPVDLEASCRVSKGDMPGSKKKCGRRAIVIMEYDDASESLRFKNSWGPNWFDGGYGTMSYAYLRQLHLAFDFENSFTIYDRFR